MAKASRWPRHAASKALTEADQADLDALARLSARHRTIVREVIDGFLPEDAGKPVTPPRAARPARPGSARFESGQLLGQRLKDLVPELMTLSEQHSDEVAFLQEIRDVIAATKRLSRALLAPTSPTETPSGGKGAESAEAYGAPHADSRSVDP